MLFPEPFLYQPGANEVRPPFELDAFAPSQALDRFREISRICH